MKKLNYEKLMAHNPEKFTDCDIVNQLGQTVGFYEHPTMGDEYPVIAIFEGLGVAVLTDFYECDDFYTDSDYNPILLPNGDVVCAFEFEDLHGNFDIEKIENI